MKIAKTVGAIVTASILWVSPMATAQETTHPETKDPTQQSQTKASTETVDKAKSAQPDLKEGAQADTKEALEKSNLTAEEKASFEALEKFVNEKEKTLDYKGAKADARIDDNVLKEYAGGLQASGWKVESVESDTQAVQESANRLAPTVETLEDSCKGENGFQLLPPAVLLDSCAASALQNAYAAGAGSAGLAALITAETGAGPILAGAVAAVLTLQSGIYGICNSWGNGIKIFPLGLCWSQ